MESSDTQTALCCTSGCEILWEFTTEELKIGITDREMGEMFQLVKRLPCRREDQSLIPKNP